MPNAPDGRRHARRGRATGQNGGVVAQAWAGEVGRCLRCPRQRYRGNRFGHEGVLAGLKLSGCAGEKEIESSPYFEFDLREAAHMSTDTKKNGQRGSRTVSGEVPPPSRWNNRRGDRDQSCPVPGPGEEYDGEYVLIKGTEIVGFFADDSSALREGYRRFAVVPPQVKRITAYEWVVYIPNVVLQQMPRWIFPPVRIGAKSNQDSPDLTERGFQCAISSLI